MIDYDQCVILNCRRKDDRCHIKQIIPAGDWVVVYGKDVPPHGETEYPVVAWALYELMNGPECCCVRSLSMGEDKNAPEPDIAEGTYNDPHGLLEHLRERNEHDRAEVEELRL